MKYVAFRKTDIRLRGLDWFYDLMEDCGDCLENYASILIEAKSPTAAREIAIDAFYEEDMRQGGLEFVIGDAFVGFCDMVYKNDEEIVQFFGYKDGKTVFEFYEKYTWAAFIEGRIKFYDGFAPADQDKFYDFDSENLKKLYQRGIWYDVLVMPITKDLSKAKSKSIKTKKPLLELNAQDTTK